MSNSLKAARMSRLSDKIAAKAEPKTIVEKVKSAFKKK